MAAREVMEVDVLFVGGGPASLSGALHLLTLVEKHNLTSDAPLGDLQIVVIEKGASLGSHILSGAVLNPAALQELIPDFLEKDCPLEGPVKAEEVCFLSKTGRYPLPLIPPPMHNEGNYICTLGKLVQWLGKLVEGKGGMIFTEVAGWELLFEGDRVVGVLTGDKGVDKAGNKKPNYEPGIEIRAKAVVLGEGPLGTLTRKAIRQFDLDKDRYPQTYATSVKEVWEVAPGKIKEGQVIHTMGYPLKDEVFGGGFIYALKGNQVSVGLVVGCDPKDPFFDTQAVFQNFKTHPYIRNILEGGRILRYGAKTIPEGGFYAIPKLTFPGGVIVGDSAGLVNVPKLKGIHYGMKSGMLAAEVIFGGLVSGDLSPKVLEAYEDKVYDSYIGKDLHAVRNFKTAFKESFRTGMVKFGIQMALGGWWPHGQVPEEDRRGMKKVSQYYGVKVDPPKRKQTDDGLTFKKLTDVYFSGTKHEEDQPVHLRVDHFKFGETDLCGTRCAQEYGNPCQYFCPAQVYEMEKDENSGELKLKINASNCVHCKTCDIMDPYNVIEWVPPEGGGGPAYLQM